MDATDAIYPTYAICFIAIVIEWSALASRISGNTVNAQWVRHLGSIIDAASTATSVDAVQWVGVHTTATLSSHIDLGCHG